MGTIVLTYKCLLIDDIRGCGVLQGVDFYLG